MSDRDWRAWERICCVEAARAIITYHDGEMAAIERLRKARAEGLNSQARVAIADIRTWRGCQQWHCEQITRYAEAALRDIKWRLEARRRSEPTSAATVMGSGTTETTTQQYLHQECTR